MVDLCNVLNDMALHKGICPVCGVKDSEHSRTKCPLDKLNYYLADKMVENIQQEDLSYEDRD